MLRWALIVAATLGAFRAEAATYHVSPTGSDQNPGTAGAPFQTLAKASATAVAGDTVLIHAGTYRETLAPQASGSSALPITFEAAPGEQAIISALDLVVAGQGDAGQWTLASGNIYALPLPPSIPIGAGQQGTHLVFLDGQPLVEARWPNGPDPIVLSRHAVAAALDGGVGASTEDGGYISAAFSASGLSALPAGSLAGGFINFSAGYDWWQQGGFVDGTDGAGNVLFHYASFDSVGPVDVPANGDPFFLWGRLAALDAPGEVYVDDLGQDGPAGRLYLWMPGGGSPSGHTLEVRARQSVIALAGSNLVVLGLSSVGGGINLQPSCSNDLLDGVTLTYGSYALNHTGNLQTALTIDGEGNTFRNGEVVTADGNCADVYGSGNMIQNTVLHGCQQFFANVAGSQNTFQGNTTFNGGDHGVVMNGPQNRYLSNHVYFSGQFDTDLGAMNAYGLGDAQGAEVAFNWVHDNLAVRDPVHTWNGGAGIRLDSGGGAGNSNWVFHHNLVWGTTQPGIYVFELVSGQVNYGNEEVLVYGNTVEGDLGLQGQGGTGSGVGIDVRDNLVGGLFDNESASLTGVTLDHNLFGGAAPAGNLTGVSPELLSPGNHNDLLVPGSPAIDAGVALPPWVAGPEVDLGAFAFGAQLALPGAWARPQDLSAVTATVATCGPQGPELRVTGLPQGRGFPPTTALQLGSGVVAMDHQMYEPVTHLATAVFLPGAGGGGAVSVGLDAGGLVGLGLSLSVPAPGVALTAAALTCVDGGTLVTVTGTNLCGTPYPRFPVSLTQLAPGDLAQDAVPVTVDSATLSALGELLADGGDLRVLGADGQTALACFQDTGVGSTQALFVRPFSVDGGPFTIATDVETGLSVAGAAALPAGGLSAVYPDLSDAGLALWLRADALDAGADGGAVLVWPDQAGDNDASPDSTSPAWVANAVNGWPAVLFNGSSDDMDVGAGLGVGSFSLLALYWDPVGGGTAFPRVASAAALGGTDYGANGMAIFTDRDSVTNLEVPEPVPQLALVSAPAGTDATAFRVAATSRQASGFYGGLLSEVLVFDPQLPAATSARVERYVSRKYGLTPAGRGVTEVSQPIAPLTVTLGGSVAQLLALDGGVLEAFVAGDCDASASGVTVTVVSDAGTVSLTIGSTATTTGTTTGTSGSATSSGGTGGMGTTGSASGSPGHETGGCGCHSADGQIALVALAFGFPWRRRRARPPCAEPPPSPP